jgi:hypothetical protein
VLLLAEESLSTAMMQAHFTEFQAAREEFSREVAGSDGGGDGGDSHARAGGGGRGSDTDAPSSTAFRLASRRPSVTAGVIRRNSANPAFSLNRMPNSPSLALVFGCCVALRATTRLMRGQGSWPAACADLLTFNRIMQPFVMRPGTAVARGTSSGTSTHVSSRALQLFTPASFWGATVGGVTTSDAPTPSGTLLLLASSSPTMADGIVRAVARCSLSLGILHLCHFNDSLSALAHLHDVVKCVPRMTRALLLRHEALRRCGVAADARLDLQRVLRLDPSLAWPYAMLGSLLLAADAPREAMLFLVAYARRVTPMTRA